MKMIWLNDSLVVRAETAEEKQALAVVFTSLAPQEPESAISEAETARVPTSPLAS
jgi:hypothetical protein